MTDPTSISLISLISTRIGGFQKTLVFSKYVVTTPHPTGQRNWVAAVRIVKIICYFPKVSLTGRGASIWS